MEGKCISFGEGTEQCSNYIFLGSKFCHKHLYSCVHAYFRYKKKESKIRPWPTIPTPKRILSRYKRLQEVYDLRRNLQKEHIHPSAIDRGHKYHLRKLEKEIHSCLAFLENIIYENENESESTEEVEYTKEPEYSHQNNNNDEK